MMMRSSNRLKGAVVQQAEREGGAGRSEAGTVATNSTGSESSVPPMANTLPLRLPTTTPPPESIAGGAVTCEPRLEDQSCAPVMASKPNTCLEI